jgi:hypothetical protein
MQVSLHAMKLRGNHPPNYEFSMTTNDHTATGSHLTSPSVADESIPVELLRLVICIILTNVNLISGYYQAQKHLLYRHRSLALYMLNALQQIPPEKLIFPHFTLLVALVAAGA